MEWECPVIAITQAQSRDCNKAALLFESNSNDSLIMKLNVKNMGQSVNIVNPCFEQEKNSVGTKLRLNIKCL